MIMTLETVRDWVTARITLLRANGDRGEIPAHLVWMGVITTLVMNKAKSITLQ
jgi:hypothetical protein